MSLQFHAYGLQYIGYPVGDLPVVLPSCCLEYEPEVILHAPVHEKLEILEYNPHFSSQIWYLLVFQTLEIETTNHSFSFAKRRFCYYRPYDRCLSCTDLSDNINKVTWIDLHVQVIYHDSISTENVGILK